MELVEVEIIGLAITQRYGTLNTGAILKTDRAYARHLVDDCGAAKWVNPDDAIEAVQEVQPALGRKPKKPK